MADLAVFGYSEHLQMIDERQVASLESEAAQLTRESQRLSLTIASAKRDAAEAHLETAKIEKEYGPRKLTGRQVIALANRAQPFAGESAFFFFPAGDIESAMFANQIAGTLKQGAGWTIGSGILVGMAVGLKISHSPDERSREAAEAMASELRKDGFPVPTPTLEPNNKQSNKLWITVGARALPEVPIAIRRHAPSLIKHAPPSVPLTYSLMHGRSQKPNFSLLGGRSTR